MGQSGPRTEAKIRAEVAHELRRAELRESLGRTARSTSSAEDRYPNAYAVPIDVRWDALAWVLERVKAAYGDDAIALRNVAALVDGVADAVAQNDRTLALVRGMRLLNDVELVELWSRLGGEQ